MPGENYNIGHQRRDGLYRFLYIVSYSIRSQSFEIQFSMAIDWKLEWADLPVPGRLGASPPGAPAAPPPLQS